MKEIERKVDEFLKGFYGDPETPCYRSPFSEELELNLQAGIVKLIESLLVDPKAESVEGLLEFIKDETSDSFYDVVDADKLREYIANNLTLPSVKPVMPEDMPESVLRALEDEFVVRCSDEKANRIYQAIRNELMNSGDKDD